MRKVYFVFLSVFLLALLSFGLLLETPEVETLSVETVILNEEYFVMNTGTTQVLLANVYPFNANNQNIIWTSSDPSVATVEDGVITAISAGNVKITATSEEGAFEDYCYVDVV